MLGSAAVVARETAVGIEQLEESVATTDGVDTGTDWSTEDAVGTSAGRVQMATHAVLWIGEFAKREQVLRKTARSAKIHLHLRLAFPGGIRCWSSMRNN